MFFFGFRKLLTFLPVTHLSTTNVCFALPIFGSVRDTTVQVPKASAMSYQQVKNVQSTIVKPNPAPPGLPITNTTVLMPPTGGASSTINDLKFFAGTTPTTATSGGLRMYRPIAPKPAGTAGSSILLSPTVTISPTAAAMVTDGGMNAASGGIISNGVVPSSMVMQTVLPSHLQPTNHQQLEQPQQSQPLYAGASKLVLPFGTTIKVTPPGMLNQQPPLAAQSNVNPQLLHQPLVHTPTVPVLQSLGTISIPKPPHQQHPQKLVLNARLPIAATSAGTIVPTNIPPLYVPPNKATLVATVASKLDGETRRIMVTTGPVTNNSIIKRRVSLAPATTVEQQELRKPIKAFPIPVLSPFKAQNIVQQQQQQHLEQNIISEQNKDPVPVPLPSNAPHFVEQCGQRANVNLSLELENEPAAAVAPGTDDDELSNDDGPMLVMDLGETNAPEVKQGEKNMPFGAGMKRAAIIAQANGENLVEVDNDHDLNDRAPLDEQSNFSNFEGLLSERNVSSQPEVSKTPEKAPQEPGATGSTSTNVSPRLQKRSSSEHQPSKVKLCFSAIPQKNPNRRRFSEFALVRQPPTGVTIPFTNEHYYIPLVANPRKMDPISLLMKNESNIKSAVAVEQNKSEHLVPPAPQPSSSSSSAQNVSLLCNETIDVPKQIEEMLTKRPLVPKQIKTVNEGGNELFQELVSLEEISRAKKQRLAKENSVERSTNSRSTSMSSDSNVPAGKHAPNTPLSESIKKSTSGSRGSGKKSSAASNQITPSESSASLLDEGGVVYDTSTVADHLRWYDGIGYLSESKMHFEFNKFGIVQPLSDEAYDRHCQTDVYRDMQLRISERPLRTNERNAREAHDLYKCEVCQKSGCAAEFVTPDYCSISCVQASSKHVLRDYILNSTHALQQANGLLKENHCFGGSVNRKVPVKAGQKQKNQRPKKKQQTVKQNVKKATPSSLTTASSTSDEDSMSSLSLNSSAFLKRQALRELMPASLDDSPPPASAARSSGAAAGATASPAIDGGEETEFNWNRYLKVMNAEAAPIHLFGPNPFPSLDTGSSANRFRIGMKMEAIDPENNSLFCVCTVAEVRGYRLKLHFDGYPNDYDFWVNANSIDIFPPGWCQKTNRVLQPPASYIGQPFDWESYLQETNGLVPENDMFVHLNRKSDRNKFEIGMAIEADDLKKSGKVCVATVADKMGDRILIHFDGWDNRYDYWVSIHSNYIHPVNWHRENNDKITPPPDWNKPFDWEKYIRYKSRNNLGPNSKAEKPLFKIRPPIYFKLGQRLEVVDRKQKKLIRPAKVVAIDGYEVSLCFEGWPREYAFWIEDDSPDLHPINWCARTKHPLEPPPNCLLSTGTFDGTCELKFCLSRGNSKFSQKKFHDRSSECPYRRTNWMSEDRKPLRVSHDQVQTHNIEKPGGNSQNMKQINARNMLDVKAPRKSMAVTAPNASKASTARRRASVTSVTPSPVPTKRIKQEVEEPPSTATSTSTPTPPPSRDPSKERIVRVKETEDMATAASNHSTRATNANESIRLARPVIEEYGPRLMHSYEIWQRHSRYLDECTEQTGVLRKNPLHWTTDEMARYIEQLPGCAEYASKIRHEEITGRSFLSFTQSDLIDYLGVKIGPAIKIYNRIIRLRQLVTTKFIQL
ncbi:uncharacterized protein LOC125771126 isoform X2 [Anopheles funestus]|uniref:uncharacterized protein LOC125771126 isoform X2 n=1 Tax=Anopheles funestus TaxID=62324 RepID=UPI0020C7144E|nr:uncharacterized protein LOC125771126 isoform X2 [Anopheles funestus]